MEYKVVLSKKVVKFLNSHEDIARSFYSKVIVLKKDVKLNTLDIKRLRWKPNHYRLRIWKYRFLYEVVDRDILIYFYDSNSRGDIY